MTDAFLHLTGISKSFAGVRALQEVDLTIERGRIHCLVGENGSGKSTLIKIIAGVYERDAGEVVINGTSYDKLQPIDAIRAGVQVIYQDFSLFPNLTVAENIALNEEVASGQTFVNWGKVRAVAKEALAEIDVRIPLNARVQDVSVANKQLIAISRALRQNARLIIMDEPTSALTEREIRSLLDVIRKLQGEGIAFLFVSHKLNEVLAVSEKIIVLRNGKNVSAGERHEYDHARLVRDMTGQALVDASYEFSPNGDATPLLRVENLSAKGTLDDISFSMQAGEIVGVTGLLGSGRTELALALFGLLPVDSGDIWINGKRAKIGDVQDAVQHGIGYVPEDRLTEGLFLERSIGSNVVVRTVAGLTNRLGLTSQGKVNGQIGEWVDALSIKTDDPALPVRTLSGGNQQRVVVAKWLASDPKLLILNGPTVGVDVGSKNELHELIRQLASEGMGLLVISDDIPELLQTCNRILLLRDGQIAAEVTPGETDENELASMLVAG